MNGSVISKRQEGRSLIAIGTILATNKTVCTISVIHSQIKDPEQVIRSFSELLDMDEEAVRKRVEKVSVLLKGFRQMWRKK